jgi:hypothetical protein
VHVSTRGGQLTVHLHSRFAIVALAARKDLMHRLLTKRHPGARIAGRVILALLDQLIHPPSITRYASRALRFTFEAPACLPAWSWLRRCLAHRMDGTPHNAGPASANNSQKRGKNLLIRDHLVGNGRTIERWSCPPHCRKSFSPSPWKLPESPRPAR